MKRALIAVEKSGMNGTKQKSVFRERNYIIGFILLFIGSFWHVLVLPFCDVVLLSTNTATGIVMSTFLSIKYLDEKPVYKYDIPSVVLIVTGCIIIVLLSSYDDKTFTSQEIIDLLTMPGTIFFFCFFICSASCSYLFWQWF